MENVNRFYLIESFTGEVISEGENLNEVMKPAWEVASVRNCGISRCWYMDNRLYIDAGPRVFYVIASALEGVEVLKNRMKGNE